MANVPWQYRQKPKGKYTDELRVELSNLGIKARVYYRQMSARAIYKKVPAYLITFRDINEMNLFNVSSKWASYKCVELKLGKVK